MATARGELTRADLTPEQRAIVEADDGPVVVVAGAGTGKTRVIVERVRWLLETKPDLLPEQLLVLTYNVKAARELQQRLDGILGPAVRARLTVTNFHSFCHRILREHPGEAGVSPNPDVLDGISQVLLLREIRPDLPLRYHSEWSFPNIVGFINRAKDELVTPDDFDDFVVVERAAFEARFGDYEEAAVRLAAQGNLEPLKKVRGSWAGIRSHERAEARGEDAGAWDERALEKAADREARRTVAGDGHAHGRNHFTAEDGRRIDALAATYVCDGAALEVLRLHELALVYRAYQAELVRRGALDFGEQIAAVATLFRVRPNLLRRWQRQYRYVLVDEFQDANVAQIELVEMLGRTPDRPDNVMVVGDDDQSIYRFRGASFAAFAEFDRRFSRPPAHDPEATPPGLPRRLLLAENFRSTERVLRAANRVIERNETRFEPGKVLRTERDGGDPVRLLVCAGPQDEAVAIVEAIRELATPAVVESVSGRRAAGVLGRGGDIAHHTGIGVVPAKRNDPSGMEAGTGTGTGTGTEAEAEAAAIGGPEPHPAGQVVPLAWNDPSTTDVGTPAPGPLGPAPGQVVPLAWNDPSTTDVGAPAGAGERTAPQPVKPRWSDVAVLYRKHKHREAIVARLRDEDIPYTVVGGLSLFGTPEIRDLEQSLRAIADPHNDVALVRMMSAGPWRLDALEILAVSRRAGFDGRHIVEVVREVVHAGDGAGEGAGDGAGEGGASAEGAPANGAPSMDPATDPATRAKLRRLLMTLEDLAPLTWREGPFTILERCVERTGQILDLIAADSLEAKRTVANIASFLRFASDWQGANPGGTLAGFVAYLDAYQQAGGELPTSVELTEDVEGVRLMTLYQAKGLEFRHVIVPCLVDGEWPVREGWSGWFPPELLREPVPDGDIHTEEERRLLYVAMTRAQDTLLVSTYDGPAVDKGPSAFIGEILLGASDDLVVINRTTGDGAGTETDNVEAEAETGDDTDLAWAQADAAAAAAFVRRVMPLPTRRERRLALRLRASELLGLIEGTNAADPETPAARERFEAGLAGIGRNAAMAADEARAAGLDPLDLRAVALDGAAGASLLQVVPVPGHFSYSALDLHERCPLRYAFSYLYRIPRAERGGALAFGSTAHDAFQAFTRERRERAARGEAPPTREDLGRLFDAAWIPAGFPDRTTEEGFRRRVSGLLDNFWDGELSTVGEAVAEEQDFELVIEPGDGSAPVLVRGGIDRIDRLPSGGIEIIDYKTGSPASQKSVDQNLQLSIYALAARDALDLGTPARVTLYFTESATRMSTVRTDAELDATRADLLARVARIRSGDFAATPGDACRWCDYRPMCPERA